LRRGYCYNARMWTDFRVRVSTDQDRIVYIVVDRVGAPYRVLLYQPSIRFSLRTNTKVSSLQQLILTLFQTFQPPEIWSHDV